MHLWFGTCLREGDTWRNAAIGLAPDGARSTYHKVNLATHERGTFRRGDDLPVFTLRSRGETVRVGVQLCREMRFPEQWGWLARRGAQVFLHLNNSIGDAGAVPVWRSHLIARAAENQRYVVSANAAASDQRCPTMVVAPSGEVLAEVAGPEERALRVDLDLSRVSDWYISQSRSDLVRLQGRARETAGRSDGGA